MKNTNIEYLSTERTPVVLPEMENLLPLLGTEEYAALETDILENGCYSPIIVNEDMIVIDGHNRLRICLEHGLLFQMKVFSFADLLEAKQWALETQKARRNLSNWELGKIALKLQPEIEARAKTNQGTRTDISATLPESNPVDTRKELAASVGLGERTMGKIMQIDAHAPDVVREAVSNGEISVNRAYDITRQVQQLSKDQREQAAYDAIHHQEAAPKAEAEPNVVKNVVRITLSDNQYVDVPEEEYNDAMNEHFKFCRKIESEHDIAQKFSRAYEKAVLLTPSPEHIQHWVSCTKFDQEDILQNIEESYELSNTFHLIGDILWNNHLSDEWKAKAREKSCFRFGEPPMDGDLVIIGEVATTDIAV